jgi:hypothetical protein
MVDLFKILDYKSSELKHVMFFHSHNLWPSHFETELELIELLKKEGIKISSFICNGTLVGCDINPSNNLNQCSKCINIRKKGYDLISLLDNVIEVKPDKNKPFPIAEKIISIEDVKKLHYKNFDVGYAALSSIVSRVRNPYITYDDYKTEFDNLIQKSIGTYNFFLSKLEHLKPDAVIIFNGRFAYSRALVRACEALGIKYYTHERGASKDKYMLFENALPHDISYFNKLLQESWDNKQVKEDEKVSIGKQFYIERAKGKQQSWFSFTDKQNKDELPEYWDENKHNIVIYLSSEDEFIAIGDQWGKTLFKNQIDGLKYIFRDTFDAKMIKFYIRIHPNSKTLKKFIEEIFEFENEQIRIIHPESTISSYKLLKKADKIITFGSTMGIEATYWGKPSINLGNCFYKDLNVTYNPNDVGEVITFINNLTLLPKHKLNTLKYGYHLSSVGYDFEIYHPAGIMKGTFKGKDLQAEEGFHGKLYSNKIKRPYRIRKLLQQLELKIRERLIKIK